MPGGGARSRRRRPLGFGPDQRVRERGAFERLLREGMRRNLDGFVFYVGRRRAGPARLGLLVTRRHSRLAVERNRLKRCIREAFRLEQGNLGSIDLLVRPPLGAEPSARLVAKLRQLMGRLPS